MALSVGAVQLCEKFHLMAFYGRNLICVLGQNMSFSEVEFFAQFFLINLMWLQMSPMWIELI